MGITLHSIHRDAEQVEEGEGRLDSSPGFLGGTAFAYSSDSPEELYKSQYAVPRQGRKLGQCLRGPCLKMFSLTAMPSCTFSLKVLTTWSSDKTVPCHDFQIFSRMYMSISEATSRYAGPYWGYSTRQDHIHSASFSQKAKAIPPFLPI